MFNQIEPNDPNGTNWVNLGQALMAWQAVISPTVPLGDDLLAPIQAEDTEGAKFAKWQRWLRAISES